MYVGIIITGDKPPPKIFMQFFSCEQLKPFFTHIVVKMFAPWNFNGYVPMAYDHNTYLKMKQLILD